MTVFLWGDPGMYGNYCAALRRAGGETRLSRSLEDAARCDALLLPGGGDVAPWRYGRANWASRDLDPERDEAELRLLARFAADKKPVLGICRGLQVINVFFGGTLRQDLPGHSQAGRDRLHRVQPLPGPGPAVFGRAAIVNSAHHQAAERLGRGLRPVQAAPDGTVEALVHERLPIWAVQWHPERLCGPLATAGAADGGQLFRAFLDVCGGGSSSTKI